MNENNSYNPYSNTSYPNTAYPQYAQNYGSSYYQGYDTSQYSNMNSSNAHGEYSWSIPQQQPQSNLNAPEGNKNDAVANEMKQQKAQLHKQREDYVKKLAVLQRELELLRNQKHELLGSRSPPRDLDAIVKENGKLQDEIQTKMKAIRNVIEMLSSIIKDGLSISDLENQLREDSPPKEKNSKSPTPMFKETSLQCNYVHYDPELHWCRMCDKFPKTAKEFLLHLQSKKHTENIQDNDVGDNNPWHKLPPEPELPHYEGAPKKRIPIKGLQFFISAPSWYCKLCDVWIGDLHCASQHLKSQVHLQNYQNFVEQNPHWEMEWLKDREKALSRTDKHSSDSDESAGTKKKRKRKDKKSFDLSRDKKKKKKSKKHKRHSSASSSSSSSSDSSSEEEEEDKSRSIRVAMRNVKAESILKEDLTGKWEMLGRLVEEHKRKAQQEEKVIEPPPKHEVKNDNLINQWMTINEPPEKEKYLLDSLKDRMKQKNSLEQAKYVELEKRQKEREMREREELEKKQREEKEAFEQRERERKEQERIEYERILNKDRNQVKFKQSYREKQHYRRASPTSSPEHHVRERNATREREHDKSKRGGRISESPKRRSRSPKQSPSNKFKKYSRGRNSRSRSKSRERKSSDHRSQKPESKSSAQKKPPGPPSYKKFPFIGRMPLFKNKKPDEKVEKEIQKEEYDKPRVTRFEPGGSNLSRAFIPDPAVVCFPKLSSYPELSLPPPAPLKPPPPAPKITPKPVKAPPPPKIEEPKVEKKPKEKKPEEIPMPEPFKNEDFDPNLYEDPRHLWENIDNGYAPMYAPMYTSFADPVGVPDTPISHMMPLQPPPLPPADDDLALLGISADDMAAQSF